MGGLFIGFMFLFDSEIVLLSSGGTPYALIDIFPDIAGWAILFFSLKKLSEKYPGFYLPRMLCIPPAALSVLEIAAKTVLFPSFFTVTEEMASEGAAFSALRTAGEILSMAFAFALFAEAAKITKNRKECPRLAGAFSLGKYFSVTKAVISAAGAVAGFLSASGEITAVISKTGYLFSVFFIWFGVISLFRMFIKLS